MNRDRFTKAFSFVFSAVCICIVANGCSRDSDGPEVNVRSKVSESSAKTHVQAHPAKTVSRKPIKTSSAVRAPNAKEVVVEMGKKQAVIVPATSNGEPSTIRFVEPLTAKRKAWLAEIKKWDTASYGDINKEFRKMNRAKSNNSTKNSARVQKLFTVYRIRLHKASQKTFIVTGSITDDSGNELSDVTMYLTKTTNHVGGWGSKDVRTEVKVGSRFKFVVDGANILYLGFWKKGYYGVRPSISDPDNEAYAGQMMAAAYKQDKFSPRVVRRHLRIILEKQGKLTRLKRYHERMVFSSDGSGKVINFDMPASDLFGDSLHTLSDIPDRKSWPKHAVVFIPKTTGQGKDRKIATYTQVINSKRYGDQKIVMPKSIKLVMTDPDGGFLPFTRPHLPERTAPLVDPKQKWHSWRIKQAPKTGYNLKVLEWEPRYPSKPIYFYFKVRGKYGWGKIHKHPTQWLGNEPGNKTYKKINCRVEFRLQADGSRNLEEGNRP